MNNSNNFFGYPAPIRAPVPFALSSQPINPNQVRHPNHIRNLLPDRPPLFPVTPGPRVSDTVRDPDKARASGQPKDPYSERLKKERQKWFRIKKQLDKHAQTILQDFQYCKLKS